MQYKTKADCGQRWREINATLVTYHYYIEKHPEQKRAIQKRGLELFAEALDVLRVSKELSN